MRIAEARALFKDAADAEVLLAWLLQKDRSWVFSHADDVLTKEQTDEIQEFSKRRGAGEPVAYLTGYRDFFGRTFKVNSNVLIPRPATEELVTIALEWIDSPTDILEEIDTEIVAFGKKLRDGKPTCVVDVGTGSGCIAVTIAGERPDLQVIGTDTSKKALSVAKENARLLVVANRVDFRVGECLDPVTDLTEPFVIVSNPPYIPVSTVIESDVADFEPKDALFSGEQGIDVLQKIVEQASDNPNCLGFLFECRKEQPITLKNFL